MELYRQLNIFLHSSMQNNQWGIACSLNMYLASDIVTHAHLQEKFITQKMRARKSII